MKISLNWLKEYLPALDLSAEDLSRTLLNLGFEVSSVERRGAAFSGIVAAKIISVDKHPNADRLSLCSVEAGGETFSVVCGAKNIAAGQVVPLAKPGARLPGGRVLTKTAIRGVESQGMLCSAAELGLGADHGGILILNPGTASGSDLSSGLTESDLILEVEVTPNRPDCLSHLGLARELSAALSLPLKPRDIAPRTQNQPGSRVLKINVADAQACPLYIGKVFSGLEIRPSPGWLCARLESIGLRPVNNLVDITNYVLMDQGQPLHAFDYDKIAGGEIAVRWAKGGESIAALDGKTYSLTPDCLVVADAQKPAAMAGVMGGMESSITEKTKRIVLESAYFSPTAVRRTSQILRLRSDASYRFERGTDPAAPPKAATLAERLISELCGKSVQAEDSQTAGSQPPRPEPISVSTARVNAILGSDFTPDEISQALEKISAEHGDGTSHKHFKSGKISSEHGRGLQFFPPTYRRDLATEWDLAEEAARLLGYERIPAKPPISSPASARLEPASAMAARCRGRLAAAGLLEAYNQDFVSEKILQAARQIAAVSWARPANPLSEEVAVLRPSLLPGLLQNAALNFSRGARAVKLFEIGKVYRKEESGVISENWRAAGVLSGPVNEIYWDGEQNGDYDFYRVKGVIEELLSGTAGWAFHAENGAGLSKNQDWGDSVRLFHPGICASIAAKNNSLSGLVGVLHPAAAAAGDFKMEVCVFEINLEPLMEPRGAASRFAPYSPFPGSWRDISIVLPEDTIYERVDETTRLAGGENFKDVRLTDVFKGNSIGAGRVSMTLRLFFGRDDRTLTESEIAAAAQAVLAALEKNLGARLRGP